MLKAILKQLGILTIISAFLFCFEILWYFFLAPVIGLYSISGGGVYGGAPGPNSTKGLVIALIPFFVLLLFWVSYILYMIHRLIKIYDEKKLINTLGIEIIYWILGVMIPGAFLIGNFFSRGAINFSILPVTLLVFMIVCSIIFWRKIRPPRYRTILFAFISLIFFLFSVYLSWG